MPLELTPEDRAALDGERGDATALAMRIVVAMAEVMDAPSLDRRHLPRTSTAACTTGAPGWTSPERLADGGARVAVPTTLNVSSLDLLHPELVHLDRATAAEARAMMDAYVAMGCRATWTCAPYQLPERPTFGEQIAWAESNAIVFANSVLGARTNRYGDFIDICCAITGRAPFAGLHTDEGRRATAGLRARRRARGARIVAKRARRRSVTSSAGAPGTAVPAIVGLAADDARGPPAGARRCGGVLGRGRDVPRGRRDPGGADAATSRPAARTPARIGVDHDRDLRAARDELSTVGPGAPDRRASA